MTDCHKPTVRVCRVLGLTRYDRLGASSRQRFFIFENSLRARGIECHWQSFFTDGQLLQLYRENHRSLIELTSSYVRRISTALRSSAFDLVWIEKELLPWLPNAFETWLLGRSRLVLDLDDGWHLRYDCAPTALQRRIFSGKIAALARRSDAVIVSNKEVDAWLKVSRLRGGTELLPTVLDPQRYVVAPEPAGPFTLAWIGSPSTVRYLKTMEPVLERLAAEFDIRLIVISHRADAPTFKHAWVEFVEWSEESEAAELKRCHVGIAPTPDGAWERYKTGYKIIQYMAAGRAVVASPVGANRDIVVADETGLFARSAAEWYMALKRLHDDPVLRHRMGEAGRRRCESTFSINAVSDRLASILLRAAAGQVNAQPAPTACAR